MEEKSRKQEAIDKAEEVANLIQQTVNKNYSTMRLADDRSVPAKSVDKNVELHNCAIVRVYLRPNDYNTHVEKEKIKKYCEEILSISTGRKATSLTDTREARKSGKRDHYSSYPDGTSVSEIGGTEKRGYPVFELEHKVPCFDQE